MNTHLRLKTMTHPTLLAALAAATVLLPTAQAQTRTLPHTQKPVIVELPRVVVNGTRASGRGRGSVSAAQIVELPRVVITARRADNGRLVQTRPTARPA